MHLDVRRNLYAKYSVMAEKLVEFFKYSREQRNPVSSSILRTHAIDISRDLGINDFKIIKWLIEPLPYSQEYPTIIQVTRQKRF